MLTDAIKQQILSLAIQGKLTDQRPEDGTAEELYRSILAEKKLLIKAGKQKKEKPLPPIEEEEIPFDIPQNWKWVRLGELCSIVTGKKDANFGKNGGEYTFFTCARTPISCPSYSFEGKAILLAGNGDLSNISMFEGKFEAYQRTYVLQNFLALDIRYLYYHLLSNWVQYNEGKTFGGVITFVRLANLTDYPVALPPLPEQERIVEKLEAIMTALQDLETAQQRAQSIKRELRKSLLQEAIQGKLTDQRPEDGSAEELYRSILAEKKRLIKAGKFKKEKPLPPIEEKDIPFDIPENWKWVRLGEVFVHNTGKAQNATAPSTGGTMRKFITTSNLYWNSFDFSKVKEMLFTEAEIERCSARKGDLLVCEGGDFGRAAIWPYDEEICIQNHIHRIRPILKLVVKLYYHIFFLYKQTNLLQGRGVAIQGLSSGALHNLVIPLPPPAEQERIVSKLEELLPLCD